MSDDAGIVHRLRVETKMFGGDMASNLGLNKIGNGGNMTESNMRPRGNGESKSRAESRLLSQLSGLHSAPSLIRRAFSIVHEMDSSRVFAMFQWDAMPTGPGLRFRPATSGIASSASHAREPEKSNSSFCPLPFLDLPVQFLRSGFHGRLQLQRDFQRMNP
jgi:hypothetical protein